LTTAHARRDFMTDKEKMTTCPTKYTDEIIVKAQNYLDNYADNGEVIPTIAGLALELSIHRATLYDWKDQEGKEQISDIIRDVMLKQEVKLINGGLSGDHNSTIVKLMLTKHGYHDKQHTELSGDAENPLTMVINEISGNTLGPASD